MADVINLKNKKLPTMPLDNDSRTPAGLIVPITDNDGHITGWAAPSTTDNGDGTLKLKVDADLSADGLAQKIDEFKSRSDTYTMAGNGVTADTHTFPLKFFAIQVVGTGGAATAWEIVVEGSLDGTHFSPISENTTDSSDGSIVWSSSNPAPTFYFRSRVVSLTLGAASDVVVTILGMR